MHWSCGWSCTDHVTDHALITCLIMHWSRGYHALITWLVIHWSYSYHVPVTWMIIHPSGDWSCTDHVAVMHWPRDWKCTDHARSLQSPCLYSFTLYCSDQVHLHSCFISLAWSSRPLDQRHCLRIPWGRAQICIFKNINECLHSFWSIYLMRIVPLSNLTPADLSKMIC